MAGAIVGTASVVALLAFLFWMPFVHARVVKKDYTLRWFHIFLGPALWFRQPPADAGTVAAPAAVSDYRVRKDDEEPTQAHGQGRWFLASAFRTS